jgi:hypothetical protein
MFPVASNLRRFADSVLLLRSNLLLSADGRYHVRLQRPSSVFDPIEKIWSKEIEAAPMSELMITASSSEAASISLGLVEDRLASLLEADKSSYTLVLGPEVAEAQGEKFLRAVRLCILRGVYRAHGPSLIPSKPKTLIAKKFSLPRGTRLEPL